MGLYFAKQVLRESLYTFLLLVAALGLLFVLRGNVWASIWAGIAMGLGILVRPEGLVVTLLWVCSLLIWFKLKWRQRIVGAILFGIVSIAIVAPWLIRNYFVLGSPSLGNSGGVTFYMGNNPTATGSYYVPLPPPNLPEGEAAQNNFYYQLGVEYIRQHPDIFFRAALMKQWVTWGSNHQLVLDTADLLLLPFVLLGFLIAFRIRWDMGFLSILISPILAVAIVSALFIGFTRYRVSAYPFLLTFAAIGLVFLFTALRDALRNKNSFVAPDSRTR